MGLPLLPSPPLSTRPSLTLALRALLLVAAACAIFSSPPPRIEAAQQTTISSSAASASEVAVTQMNTLSILLPPNPRTEFELKVLQPPATKPLECFHFEPAGSCQNLVKLAAPPEGTRCQTSVGVAAVSTTVTNGSCSITVRSSSRRNQHFTVEVYVQPLIALEILTTVRRIGVLESETVFVQGRDSVGNVFSSLSGLDFVWSASEISVLRVESIDTNIPRNVVHGVTTGTSRLAVKWEGIRSEVSLDVMEIISLCPPTPATGLPLLLSSDAGVKYEFAYCTKSVGCSKRGKKGRYAWREGIEGEGKLLPGAKVVKVGDEVFKWNEVFTEISYYSGMSDERNDCRVWVSPLRRRAGHDDEREAEEEPEEEDVDEEKECAYRPASGEFPPISWSLPHASEWVKSNGYLIAGEGYHLIFLRGGDAEAVFESPVSYTTKDLPSLPSAKRNKRTPNAYRVAGGDMKEGVIETAKCGRLVVQTRVVSKIGSTLVLSPGSSYDVQHMVRGGSGKYTVSLLSPGDPSTPLIRLEEGMTRVVALPIPSDEEGEKGHVERTAKILIADAGNKANFVEMEVLIAPLHPQASRISRRSPREVGAGTKVKIGLSAVTAVSRRAFHNCSAGITWACTEGKCSVRRGEGEEDVVDAPDDEEACDRVVLKAALTPGVCTVVASSSSRKRLATADLIVFQRAVVSPKSSAIVAVGDSYDFEVLYGPSAARIYAVEKAGNHSREHHVDDARIFKLGERRFRVTCEALGVRKFLAALFPAVRGTREDDDDPSQRLPPIDSVEFTVECAEVKGLAIGAISASSRSDDPSLTGEELTWIYDPEERLENTSALAGGPRFTTIRVFALDDAGRTFDNATSSLKSATWRGGGVGGKSTAPLRMLEQTGERIWAEVGDVGVVTEAKISCASLKFSTEKKFVIVPSVRVTPLAPAPYLPDEIVHLTLSRGSGKFRVFVVRRTKRDSRSGEGGGLEAGEEEVMRELEARLNPDGRTMSLSATSFAPSDDEEEREASRVRLTSLSLRIQDIGSPGALPLFTQLLFSPLVALSLTVGGRAEVATVFYDEETDIRVDAAPFVATGFLTFNSLEYSKMAIGVEGLESLLGGSSGMRVRLISPLRADCIVVDGLMNLDGKSRTTGDETGASSSSKTCAASLFGRILVTRTTTDDEGKDALGGGDGTAKEWEPVFTLKAHSKTFSHVPPSSVVVHVLTKFQIIPSSFPIFLAPVARLRLRYSGGGPGVERCAFEVDDEEACTIGQSSHVLVARASCGVELRCRARGENFLARTSVVSVPVPDRLVLARNEEDAFAFISNPGATGELLEERKSGGKRVSPPVITVLTGTKLRLLSYGLLERVVPRSPDGAVMTPELMGFDSSCHTFEWEMEEGEGIVVEEEQGEEGLQQRMDNSSTPIVPRTNEMYALRLRAISAGSLTVTLRTELYASCPSYAAHRKVMEATVRVRAVPALHVPVREVVLSPGTRYRVSLNVPFTFLGDGGGEMVDARTADVTASATPSTRLMTLVNAAVPEDAVVVRIVTSKVHSVAIELEKEIGTVGKHAKVDVVRFDHLGRRLEGSDPLHTSLLVNEADEIPAEGARAASALPAVALENGVVRALRPGNATLVARHCKDGVCSSDFVTLVVAVEATAAPSSGPGTGAPKRLSSVKRARWNPYVEAILRFLSSMTVTDAFILLLAFVFAFTSFVWGKRTLTSSALPPVEPKTPSSSTSMMRRRGEMTPRVSTPLRENSLAKPPAMSR